MTVQAPAADSPSLLHGVKELLMGPAGTGKTHAVSTLTSFKDLEVFYLALEPGLETLLGAYRDRGLPLPDNLHWHTLAAKKASFSDLLTNARKVNSMALDSLAKMQDPNRSKHTTFMDLLEVLNNFRCQRTGEVFGAVDEWGPNRVLVIDSLTGLNNAAMSLVIGGKPVRNQSDWGIAQDQLYALLNQICNQCKCHVILLAHVERETDMVLGGVKIMVATLGKALGPKLPALFSDVILTVREGSDFTWNTGSSQADVKARNLPIKDKLPPTFVQVLEKWLSRGGKFTPTVLDMEIAP